MLEKRRSQAGSSLIGIVIALAILCLLIIVGTRMYLGQQKRLDDQSAEVLEESGIQSHGNKSVLQTAKERIAEDEKLIQSQKKRIDEVR
jgi:Tfp pilus assembly protein PilN